MTDTPVVNHAALREFADSKINLHRDDLAEYRAQVNRLREKLEDQIIDHPGFGLVKMLHAGSVAKGTALSTINDMDVAVYVRADAAPLGDAELLPWIADRLRESYPNLDRDQFVVQQHCVTVSFRGSGLDVDVVPVLVEDPSDDEGCLIAKDSGDRVLTNVAKHLQFIRSRRKEHGREFTELIRIVKWWIRQQKRQNEHFRFKSFLAELVVAHLTDTRRLDVRHYPDALEAFFAYLVKSELKERIGFTDYYNEAALPCSLGGAIEAFDPVNPTNNVAKRYSDADRALIVAAAQDAFDAVSEAQFATSKGQAYDCWRDVLGPSFGR